MAGDWLKFEKATPDKPEVWQIASSVGIDSDAVVGKLLRVWSWFDDQTENGNAPIVTKTLLDRNVGVIGFCNAMIEVGWMAENSDSISLPNFSHHNGKTAKNRALTAKRVADHKAKSNAKGNGDSVTSALPREEKRREDNTLSLNIIESGWSLNDQQIKDAKYHRPDLDDLTILNAGEKFEQHYRSIGDCFEDWDARWIKWIISERS